MIWAARPGRPDFKMKIRLLTGIAGVANIYQKGEVVDLEPKEALRWVNAGAAEYLNEIEAAMKIYPEETALAPEHKKKKRR
jgi:hypothetical protein